MASIRSLKILPRSYTEFHRVKSKIYKKTPWYSVPSVVFILFFLFSFSFLFAGENFVSLGSEIIRLEKLSTSSPSAQERQSAFMALARLFQLSGNNEAALKAWESALKINSGDGRSLLEKSRLLISLGEYEKALEPLTAIFAGSYSKAVILEARFLVAQLEAFHSANIWPLAALADESDFSEYRPLIYYTLWKIDQNPAWKSLLSKDFPSSPEAKIANGNSGAANTALQAQTPLWILFPGREDIGLTSPTQSSPPAALPSQSPAASGTFLQAGLFSREENARALSEKINKAGFQTIVQTKPQNNATYWVVYVPYGSDMNAMIKRLKDAGFDSFPVTIN
jgi:tetratricopeptide (TPR) repeat protein